MTDPRPSSAADAAPLRIAYLAAGAAGMYCGSCLHDNALAAALRALGEDVVLAPIYTPLRTDEPDVSTPRVFIGGINAYLQQKSALFRRLPKWLDGWLDRPGVLRWATGRSLSVDPARLGPMTVSMLRGELGRQAKEVERLADWLAADVQPHIVHLSNAMMLGLARRIGQKCRAPVVCALSGEDLFLEKLRSPYYQQARQALRERAAEVAAFTALNRYYADAMSAYLDVPRGRIHVVPHGLNLVGFSPPDVRQPALPLRVGYFARICPDKGLHLLVEAAELLSRRSGVPPFEVHAAGYLGAADRPYLQRIQRQAEAGPLAGRFFYHGSPDRKGKIALLQSLTVFSVPTVYRESKGLPVLEAWAAGCPVVVPRHGAFPELLDDAAGGLLHEPLSVADLAEKLAELLRDPSHAARLGAAGSRAVHERFHARLMAERTRELYRQATVQPAASA